MREGWEVKKLGEICQVNYGTRVVNKKHGGTKFPVYGGGGATFYMDTFNRQNCLIVARFAMSVQCTRFVKGEFFLNDSGLTVDTPNPDLLLQSFLDYQIIFLNDHIYSLAKGTAQKNLNVPAFRNIELLYPNSIPEQERIVSILDKAFAAIDKAKANAEQNLKNAKELFESYLQGVFEKKGEGWHQKKLGEIGKVSMCKRVFKEQTSSSGEIPFYKIGTFGKTPDAYISKEIYEHFKNKYPFPKKGDILISASGTIGRRVIFDGEPGYFQDSNIIWIDNDEREILNEFLYHFYAVCNWGSTQGATISRLYNENLKQIAIAYPSIEKQQALILSMNISKQKSESLISLYKKRTERLDEIKKSILNKAFLGELSKI